MVVDDPFRVDGAIDLLAEFVQDAEGLRTARECVVVDSTQFIRIALGLAVIVYGIDSSGRGVSDRVVLAIRDVVITSIGLVNSLDCCAHIRGKIRFLDFFIAVVLVGLKSSTIGFSWLKRFMSLNGETGVAT